jgi:hypothetical protein
MVHLISRGSGHIGGDLSVGGATSLTGALSIAGALTALAGLSPNVEERTAVADPGGGTGVISAGTTFVQVTSGNAAHVITLPAPVIGQIIVINVGANGYELRSSDPATIAINGGSGAGAESALAANTTAVLFCVSATAWKGFFMDADSDVAKVEAAA